MSQSSIKTFVILIVFLVVLFWVLPASHQDYSFDYISYFHKQWRNK